MSQKITIHEKVNIANIAITLVLSIATIIIAYNSYKISVNTFNNTEAINNLNNRQSEFELKSAILSLINISSTLQQETGEKADIALALKSFSEMKSVLESQIKNGGLIKYSDLGDRWLDLLMDINFHIKYFEPGLRPTVIIGDAKRIIAETEQKSSDLLKLFFDKKSPASE